MTVKKKKSVFDKAAKHFENQAVLFAALADKSKNIAQKAALYREAAHYCECVVRLRGGTVFPLSLKKQRPDTYRSRRTK